MKERDSILRNTSVPSIYDLTSNPPHTPVESSPGGEDNVDQVNQYIGCRVQLPLESLLHSYCPVPPSSDTYTGDVRAR